MGIVQPFNCSELVTSPCSVEMSGFGKGVLLKGLPFTCTKDDIKAFFKSITIADDNIHILKYRDGKATGLAFVRLSSQEEVHHACLMDKNHIGLRYVDVVPSNEVEMYQLVLEARSGTAASDLYRLASDNPSSGGEGVDGSLSKTRDRSPIRSTLNTRFCYITGIPAGNNYKEVRKFLTGCLIGRNCIHLCKGSKGLFTGDGYIEFANSSECLKGLQLSGNTLDGSVIQLEPCYEEELVDFLRDEGRERASRSGRRGDRTPSPVRKRMEAYEATYGRDHGREHWEHSGDRGRGLSTRDREIEHDRLREYYEHYLQEDERRYRQSYDAAVNSLPLAVHYPRPSPDMPAYYEGASRGAEAYGQHYMRQVHHAPDGYSTTAYAQLQHQQYGRGGGGGALKGSHGGGNVGVYPEEYDGAHHAPTVPMPMGAEPTTGGHQVPPREQNMIRMEGLPYNVTVQDIVAFFRGFHLDFEHVRIQCRDDGSPSGKAFVVFASERHARAAILDYNRRYIGGRFVELFLI